MFPHDLTHRGAPADLSVDLGIDVVLVGLQPVYTHGLYAGLTAMGLRCSIVPATDELTAPITAGRTVVAIVPSGVGPAVRAADGAHLPAVHVLAEGSAQAYSDALRAGATGAFAENAELADIVRIVMCAGLGLTLLPVDVARNLNHASAGSRPDLTSSDLRYLRMLADGATVASLGRHFCRSEREMYRLLSATYQRLGARNRTEALLRAQGFGLLDLET